MGGGGVAFPTVRSKNIKLLTAVYVYDSLSNSCVLWFAIAFMDQKSY